MILDIGIYGALSIVLSLASGLLYLSQTIRKIVLPSFYAFIAYASSTTVAVVSSVKEGSVVTLLPGMTNVLLLLLILAAVVYQKRVTPISNVDKISLGIISLGIIVAVLYSNPKFSIMSTLLIEVMSTTMILFKMKNYPGQESVSPWLLVAGSYTAPLLVSTTFGWGSVFSYCVIACSLSVALYAYIQKNIPINKNTEIDIA